MKKYLIILASLAVVMLMVSNATAVPTTKSQSANKILSTSVETQQFIDSKIEELNTIEEKKSILEDGTDSLKEKFQQHYLKLITGVTGPFIDWLINLIENIIAAINSIIDFIQALLNLGELIDLLISVIQQLVDVVTQFIEWIMGILNPSLSK